MFIPYTEKAFLQDVTAASDKINSRKIYYLAHRPRYRSFEIAKSRNLLISEPPKMRQILEPVWSLKFIQERILRLILSPAADCLPACVHGCVPGRSVVSNAKPHLNGRLKIHMDIRDFFPTITTPRVYGVFHKIFGYGKRLAWLLANLSCYEGKLPQGAPTSPMIANFVAIGLDRSIIRLIRPLRGYYTRYVDDLTFSFRSRLLGLTADTFTRQIAQIVESHNFTVNLDKTSIVSRRRRMVVTGVVVNSALSVPKQFRKNLRAALYQHRHGIVAADPEVVIRGKLAYVKMINTTQHASLVRSHK